MFSPRHRISKLFWGAVRYTLITLEVSPALSVGPVAEGLATGDFTRPSISQWPWHLSAKSHISSYILMLSDFHKRQVKFVAVTTLVFSLSLVLGEFVHSALVPHGICAEHGEAIELEKRPGRENSFELTLSTFFADLDHHCALCCLLSPTRKKRGSSLASTLSTSLIPLAKSPPYFEREKPIIRFFSELFRLAPKTSPPCIV